MRSPRQGQSSSSSTKADKSGNFKKAFGGTYAERTSAAPGEGDFFEKVSHNNLTREDLPPRVSPDTASSRQRAAAAAAPPINDESILAGSRRATTISTRVSNLLGRFWPGKKQITQEIIDREHMYGCHDFRPVPVALSRGKGVFVWDVEGKRYFDFLSAYSAVNQGHCHPRLQRIMKDQSEVLTLTSNALYNDALGEYEEYITRLFKYDKVVQMNTDIEAVEWAMKQARRWASAAKKVPESKAKVVFAKKGSFAVISVSTDPANGDGPFMPAFETVDYDNLSALEEAIKDPNAAAFVVEPIQVEAGVVVPDECYLQGVEELCKKHNVLFIINEVHTGLGRTGHLLAHYRDGVRPDMVVLGKALSGGMYPISAVLFDDDILKNIEPRLRGFANGGSPMAARLAMAALKILVSEKLSENAAAMGEVLISLLRMLPRGVTVRGRGLLCAIVIKSDIDAGQVCARLRERGLLTTNMRSDVIELAPPLCIDEKQINEVATIIIDTIQEFVAIKK